MDEFLASVTNYIDDDCCSDCSLDSNKQNNDRCYSLTLPASARNNNANIFKPRRSSMLAGDFHCVDAEKTTPLSRHEIDVLNATFNIVKQYAAEIGHDGMEKVVQEMPYLIAKIRPTTVNNSKQQILSPSNWELLSQGILFLNGIERFLSRAGRPDLLRNYTNQLLTNERMNVTGQELARSLVLFEDVIVKFVLQHLATVTTTQPPNEIRSTWRHFFSIIIELIHHQR